MRSCPLLFLFILIGYHYGLSQVKIGENPHEIDAFSILELESTDRALVLTRVTDSEMNEITPLNGALVYNIDAECVFVFEGTIWKSLCNSENTTMPSNSVKSGNGPPSASTIENAIAGDIYVDTTNGELYTNDGSDWIYQSGGLQVTNGLIISDSGDIELGGTLIRPTVIQTNITNTLALEGLETVEDNSMVVTIDETTGVLNRTPISSLVQKEEIIITANNGQNRFNTPLAITNAQKIDVYRNGIKIDFIAIDGNTIELETDIICYQNDQIRIVQYF